MENEVIVELLGEGGSRALYCVRWADQSLFALDIVEQVDPPATRSGKPVVDSWPRALELLDANAGWYNLTPKNVHPDFRRALLEAVVLRAAVSSNGNALSQWEAACSAGSSSDDRPLLTKAPVHSSDQWLYEDVQDLEPSDVAMEVLREKLRRLGATEDVIDRMAPRKSR
jgi:hypothetical protein